MVACVTEPVLCSPGGGGFLLARPVSGMPRVYDFFVQTPAARQAESTLDFRPILADFGAVTQEFHIGLGTVAVPGLVRGLFDIHRDLGTLPMADVVAQAVGHAKNGIAVTPFQAYLFQVVSATFTATEACHRIFRSAHDGAALVEEGETLASAGGWPTRWKPSPSRETISSTVARSPPPSMAICGPVVK